MSESSFKERDVDSDDIENLEEVPLFDPDINFIENLEEPEGGLEMLRCNLCEFTTKKKNGLNIHIGVKHKQDFESLENPEHDDFIVKKCGDGNCSQLFNNKKRCIIILHDKFCWSFYSPCSNLSSPPPNDDTQVFDPARCGMLHIGD